MKKNALFLLLLFTLLLFGFKTRKAGIHPLPYLVPEQRFDAWQEIGLENYHDTITVHSFEWSPQVKLWEYREYLAAVKKDSSGAFYRSQFPDSAMCAPELYREYMNNPYYDDFPVVGVSWDNARNYLHWLTVRANKDSILDTVYRLPLASEWLAAWHYCKTLPALADEMNRDYSDWTLNAKDETFYSRDHKFWFRDMESTYDALPGDPPVMKRKVFMGNSFHFGADPVLSMFNSYGYEYNGYSWVSFRYLREVLTPEQLLKMKYHKQVYLKNK